MKDRRAQEHSPGESKRNRPSPDLECPSTDLGCPSPVRGQDSADLERSAWCQDRPCVDKEDLARVQSGTRGSKNVFRGSNISLRRAGIRLRRSFFIRRGASIVLRGGEILLRRSEIPLGRARSRCGGQKLGFVGPCASAACLERAAPRLFPVSAEAERDSPDLFPVSSRLRSASF